MLLGSHVGMSGKAMLLGSAKEAVSYGANTFMFYTGAPQNTRRKDISELNIDAAWEYMHAQGIEQIVVHAPYIINLGNSVKPETFELAVNFLRTEIERTRACKSHVLILHPGAHVGAGTDVGISQIIKGLNEVLTPDTDLQIALETMAGKGSEIGRNFEELARIIDGVTYNEKLSVCFDTCHTHDRNLTILSGKNVLPFFILTTAKMSAVLPKTAMLISASARLVLMHYPISCIIRILPMFQRYWRRLISLHRSRRRNLTHRTNMKLRC